MARPYRRICSDTAGSLGPGHRAGASARLSDPADRRRLPPRPPASPGPRPTGGRRYREEGREGLHDRSCRPHHPRRLRSQAEVVRLRRERRPPPRLAAPTGPLHDPSGPAPPPSASPRGLDRPSGRLVRRCERQASGEPVHLEVERPGRIPTAVAGTSTAAGDDRSRLTAEILPDQRGVTGAAFPHRPPRSPSMASASAAPVPSSLLRALGARHLPSPPTGPA